MKYHLDPDFRKGSKSAALRKRGQAMIDRANNLELVLEDYNGDDISQPNQ